VLSLIVLGHAAGYSRLKDVPLFLCVSFGDVLPVAADLRRVIKGYRETANSLNISTESGSEVTLIAIEFLHMAELNLIFPL